MQCGGRQTAVRIGRTRHVAHHSGQIELEHTLVFGGNHLIRPQTSGLGVVFHEGNLLRFTAGQFQIGNGLSVDVEHRRSRTEFRTHIGNGCTIADGETISARSEEFDIGTHHTLTAQELGQSQHDVGGSDARLTLTHQLDACDVRQTHHGRQTQHDGFGFQTADTNCKYTQRVNVRSVGVSSNTGIRKSNTVTRLNHRRHLFQIDLVHDAVTGRDYIYIFKRSLSPLNEVKPVFVTTVFNIAIFLKCIRVETSRFHRQRVIHDQLGRHNRVDQ